MRDQRLGSQLQGCSLNVLRVAIIFGMCYGGVYLAWPLIESLTAGWKLVIASVAFMLLMVLTTTLWFRPANWRAWAQLIVATLMFQISITLVNEAHLNWGETAILVSLGAANLTAIVWEHRSRQVREAGGRR